MLGLRSLMYPNSQLKGAHPDQQPCPSWCWNGQEGEIFDHEIDRDHPMVAVHHYDGGLEVAASHYPGKSDGEVVEPAVILCRLTQVGQGAPQVNVLLRQYKPDGLPVVESLLKLSITDADEVAAVLQFLVKKADA